MEQNKNNLLHSLKHLIRGERINEGCTEESPRPRDWESSYRNRWGHDKVVRSTHGVNCTGSCSWKIHVKDGIITWETQQTDYPSTGDDFPEYEPRGCPRGASFSWYTYSPTRVKYPYVRGDLYALWKEELIKADNPVQAWENIVTNPEKRERYVKARGKGGFVRGTWKDICEMIAAASIYTIKKYGPDRVVGFSPIPAMSMVSYSGGTRFLSLIGGTILSFYDWYADLPPASPQVWGDQTDVPESADWYNTKYFIIWGTNIPQTRTPDAHFMVESRYNGTKVVGVSPDYAEYEKFADLWLPAKAGTDGALAMAMTHVILKEFYVDKETPYFVEYAKQYTDLPCIITLSKKNENYRSDRFLRASDLSDQTELGEWKTVVWDETTDDFAIPNGSEGFRWDNGKEWNLDLYQINPRMSFLDDSDDNAMVEFPYFGEKDGGLIKREVPIKKIKDKSGNELIITTVYDLMLAHTGISRGLKGDYPTDYNDDKSPYTPAWQESITGVNRAHVIQVAREFAENAALTKGKSMIAMGGGTNHWFHSDQIYRSILNLVLLTGSQGVNGGGWAHYVGQEKVRPLEGFSQIAFANDWVKSPRFMNGTSFFYFATEQFRYEYEKREEETEWGSQYSNMHPADFNALSARLGWLPSFPQLSQNSLDIVKEARTRHKDDHAVIKDITKQLVEGKLDFAIENPNDPRNFPRVFFNWRSNLLGDSGKGHEYFVKHLIGSQDSVLGDPTNSWQPEHVNLSEKPPEGKTDLFVSMDFRMTSSGLFSDIILPAATWYEKYDISSTDLHPFVHPFNAAISPPWETRSDWDAFREIAKSFSELAKNHLPAQEDLVLSPLAHDTINEIAQPFGKVKDWRKGEVEAIPGKTLPNFNFVKRDYPNVYDMWITVGPNIKNGYGTKGVKIPGDKVYKELLDRLGPSKHVGIGKGYPDLYSDKKAINAILLMSGATNGKRAVEGWKSMEEKTGKKLSHVSEGREEEDYTLDALTIQPRPAISTPVWSGMENDNRRYSPFTVNKEFNIPWHTLTGRQSFYLDHEVILDFGEGLPLYIPPITKGAFVKGEKEVETQGKSITLRYMTPHQKWGIHTMFTDTNNMAQLFRGWQVVWMNEEDGASIGIKDNDWIEMYNRNGVVVARAVLTYRMPRGAVYMYHAQDRHMGVPGNTINKVRGGTHNSVTRIYPKATHMIGGYSQLSYGFNYYGPTGSQRDTMTIIRPLKEVDWLED
ncbi:nitrate reductase subunit alpha [Bacillus sp. AFS076308]|uniref:nitrate reductase subunit alpha n=1 Tax=unclassified Bacillus (in: firmicutes) TaxID=185979 RepID=UPI000BF322AC|nr:MULTISPECIES: nitrate reductase subunit alpha [unclassified Bacillus (in: firmicutes)]PFO08380.1 nitrate reductase subunit alpha [Bacillus sp. AFS076308]PGV50611.1 nitrate reductase subunit alpha [Bacillus sp. AFS037270]